MDGAKPSGADRWFGPNLRRARIAAGITQAELADRMERALGRPYSQQTLSKIETGSQVARLGEAVMLARFAGSDIAALSRSPEVADVPLAILRIANQVRTAHDLAEDHAAEFVQRREALRQVLAAAEASPDGDVLSALDAGKHGHDALSLRLSWED